jgi:predicted Zn-dependent peptidase
MKNLAGAKWISADELAVAKQRRMRGYAQRFESLDRVTGEIGNLWVIGLPLTELQREYDGTAAQTLEQVLAAEKKYVNPSTSAVLLVGDRAKVEKDVKALNLGEVVLLDTEGKPVAASTQN